jgi:hypothetical protein
MPLIGAREVAATMLRIPYPLRRVRCPGLHCQHGGRPVKRRGLRLGIKLRERDTLCGGVGACDQV